MADKQPEDMTERSRTASLEIMQTGQALLGMHDSPAPKDYLMDGKTRDALIEIFKREGYSGIVDQLEQLPEIADFDLA